MFFHDKRKEACVLLVLTHNKQTVMKFAFLCSSRLKKYSVNNVSIGSSRFSLSPNTKPVISSITSLHHCWYEHVLSSHHDERSLLLATTSTANYMLIKPSSDEFLQCSTSNVVNQPFLNEDSHDMFW